jgi:hypothetical protein
MEVGINPRGPYLVGCRKGEALFKKVDIFDPGPIFHVQRGLLKTRCDFKLGRKEPPTGRKVKLIAEPPNF